MGDIAQDSDISFLSGFLPKESPLTDEDVNHPNVQSYLNYLNTYEGKPQPNQMVGYKPFDNLKDHPRQQIPFNNRGDTSDAAGAYQIKASTWDQQKKKLGLKDFTLPSQQKAAVGILKDIGALEHIKNGEFEKANELAKNQWASLPGSTIGLATGQIPKLNPEAEAILAKAKSEYDPDISFVGGFKPKTELTEEDLSKPYFGNPNLTRQGEKSRATTKSGLIPFVEDIAKPLSEVDIKKSTPALLLKGTVGGQQSRMEVAEEASKQAEALVNGIRNFYNNPDKLGSIQKGLINAYEHPGEVLGGAVAGTIMHPEQIPIGGAVGKVIGKVAEPIGSAASQAFKDVAETPEFQRIVARAKTIKEQSKNAIGSMQDVFQQAKQAGAPKASFTVEGAPNVGAALADKQTVINSLMPDLSPETQEFIKSHPVENINIPALQTKALEEKHGITLSEGQRTNPARYAEEWNKRGADERINGIFANQPQQFSEAFDNLLDKHAPDIRDFGKENLGQLEINGLLAKDKIRTDAIRQAYKDLEDANAGQFPIDVKQLNTNIDSALNAKLKKNVYEDKLGTIKKDIDGLVKNGNMTFNDFENLRSNLADEMRTNPSGSARAAAHIIREQLEQIPMPENLTNVLPLANKARSLYAERANIIKNNPAYKAAVKEMATSSEAEGELSSLNAAKFHDKFISNATPEAARRMINEVADIPEAMQAVRANEILNAKEKAGLAGDRPQLRQQALNKYLRSQAEKANSLHTPESIQDLADLDLLAGKVAQPKEQVFNNSNSTSAFFADLAKQGLQAKGEMALATGTKGLSILPVNILKQQIEKMGSENFARRTVHPHSGLVNKE